MDQNTDNPNINPDIPPQTPPPGAGAEIPPQTPPTGQVPPVQPGTFAASSEERTMAMLCHLLGLFTSFVGPLILWLIKKDESKFIDDQGKEALNFQITVIMAGIVSGLLSLVCIGILIGIAVTIADVVFCILAAVAANKGQAYRYPASIRLIK